MLEESLFRFLIGGLVVSTFATLGDLFKPKNFAGLFGSAPSVALATLGLAVSVEGPGYAATETRSMTAGAIAFLVYTSCVCWVMRRYEWSALGATTALVPVWFGTAFGLWYIFLK